MERKVFAAPTITDETSLVEGTLVSSTPTDVDVFPLPLPPLTSLLPLPLPPLPKLNL